MKRFIITSIVFIILFSMLVLFANQPAEQGTLIFAANQGDVAARFLKKRQVGKPAGVLPITLEEKSDGTLSSVYFVKSLPEFLFIYFQHNKPVFVRFFAQGSNNNQTGQRSISDSSQQAYHALAKDMKDKAVFMSIDTSIDSNMIRLFSMLLSIKLGVDGAKKPFFLFCKKGFVNMQDKGVLNFNRACLEVLKPEDGVCLTKDQILLSISGGDSSSKTSSFWGKIKGLFRSGD